MTVLFTKGMIAADFLGDRTGIRIGHVLPNGPQQEAVGLFFLAAIAPSSRHLHGSTKLAGEGRLWMMRCTPSISIVAQSVSMELILPPPLRGLPFGMMVLGGQAACRRTLRGRTAIPRSTASWR